MSKVTRTVETKVVIEVNEATAAALAVLLGEVVTRAKSVESDMEDLYDRLHHVSGSNMKAFEVFIDQDSIGTEALIVLAAVE